MPSKGYRELVRAVSFLARAGVAVQLELAGEPWTDQDNKWIVANADSPAVSFRGPVTGAAKWNALGRAHVLALPSTATEGQPLAILEGMAAGCAILTTARGGIGETVDQSQVAMFEPLEGDALEAEIKRVLLRWSEDRDEVARAGQAAKTRYERAHTPERFIRLWLAACQRPRSSSRATV